MRPQRTLTAADMTPSEKAAWAVAVQYGIPIDRNQLRRLLEAAMPPDKCSACNRWSRTMRDRGDGILWCGRTDCLPAIRELMDSR